MCQFAPDLQTSQVLKLAVGLDGVQLIALALMEESTHMCCQDTYISKSAAKLVFVVAN